ncbi:MAG: S-methyl-5'-thioadenosine phosphorylase [Anaerolineaceae bacterium]|nr:S-methyl-5'-thioadenosine phosphorylase [Anaerolineaceae bacterium]
MRNDPILAVIGGSGLYEMDALQNTEEVEIETPYGKPSSSIIRGTLDGKEIAFLARHGIGHVYSPTQVNYRANIYALKSIGVKKIVSISACGSLRDDFKPGDIVIPDQLIDFTKKRQNSFFEEGLVVHVGTAEPYCSDLHGTVCKAIQSTIEKTSSPACIHDSGSFITIEGPRFSTRAESNLFRTWGVSIIGMTACPEAFLAREAEICYTTIAHVTDYDVWHITEEPVSVDMVIKTLMKNTQLAKESIRSVLSMMDAEQSCECKDALADAVLTNKKAIQKAAAQKASIIIDKYL